MNAAISALSTQKDERAASRDKLKAEFSDVQRAIAVRREAQQKHSRYLDSQARHNAPELAFWRGYLGLHIEGAGVEDKLKFVFTHVDERDWDREAWFLLSMGQPEYEVFDCRPKLQKDEVDRVLYRLNEGRDLSLFLKGMRELFHETMKR